MVARRIAAWLASALLVSAPRRSTLGALLLGAIVCGVVLSVITPIARAFETAIVNNVEGRYLELSTNYAWCGRYPYVTSERPANQRRIDLMNVHVEIVGSRTLRSIINHDAGSIAEYCQMDGDYSAIAEPSMVIVEGTLLSLKRLITVEGIGWGLAWIAAAALGLFVLALVKLRWPMPFAAAAGACALYLTVLMGSTALYGHYRLLLPATLAGIGIGAWCISANLHRRLVGFIIASLVMGVWTSFLANLRTSLYPTALLIAGLFIAVAMLDLKRSASRSRRQLAIAGASSVIALLIGYAAYDVPFVAPNRAARGYSYHVIAHPLVLGLATVPNELAAREHLRWNDAVGLDVARRIDPTVQYLAPGYEQALWTYYFRLWRTDFRAMTGIYIKKLATARTSAADFLASNRQGTYWFRKEGRWLALAAWPALTIASVVGVIGLFLALGAVGAAQPRGLGIDAARGFCLMAISVAGLMNFAESSVILSDVVLGYSSIYLFALLFAGLLVYQSGVDAAGRWLVDRYGSRREGSS
jgi:hypothetical protein